MGFSETISWPREHPISSWVGVIMLSGLVAVGGIAEAEHAANQRTVSIVAEGSLLNQSGMDSVNAANFKIQSDAFAKKHEYHRGLEDADKAYSLESKAAATSQLATEQAALADDELKSHQTGVAVAEGGAVAVLVALSAFTVAAMRGYGKRRRR